MIEDSTDGRSYLKPLTYKGDVLTQTWVDSRVLATLVRWMEKNGVYPMTMSDVARKPLELLMEFLVDKGEVELVDDTAEARTLLMMRFKVNLNRGGRGEKNVLHNQILTGERQELGDRLQRQRVVATATVPAGRSSLSQITEEAIRVYKELERQEHGGIRQDSHIQLSEEDIAKITDPTISKEEYEERYSAMSPEDKKKVDEMNARYLAKKRQALVVEGEVANQKSYDEKLGAFMSSIKKEESHE
jgi:hypothetical protein